MKLTRRALLGGAASLLTGEALAQPDEEAIAIVGGAPPRNDGAKTSVIVMKAGEITYVGDDRSKVGSAKVVSASGQFVTGGLVDLLTNVGVVEVSLEGSTRDASHDSKDPVRAAFKTADGYNPASTLIPIARTGGLTSVGVMPTEGLVTGQSAWVDLDGTTPSAIARSSLAMHIHLGFGWLGARDSTRGTAMLRLRELFDDARVYQKNKQAFERRQLRKLGASRLDLEVVVRALEGKLPTVIHVDRASDIVTVLALASEQGLELVLASAAEAWKVAAAIAKAKVPVILHALDHGPRTFAALGSREDNAALLHKAGVTVALSTGESHNVRKLRQEAGNAVRAGLPYRAALDAVTEVPARIMGMADYGTPKAGRVANVVLWSGDPFELSTRVVRMFIRGRQVSLRTRQTALFERYR